MFDFKEDATVTHLLNKNRWIFSQLSSVERGVLTPRRLTFEHSQTVPVQKQQFLGLQSCCYRVLNEATPEFLHMSFRHSVAKKVICSYLKLWCLTRRHHLITAPDKSGRGRWSHHFNTHEEFFMCELMTVELMRMSWFEWQALDFGMQQSSATIVKEKLVKFRSTI